MPRVRCSDLASPHFIHAKACRTQGHYLHFAHEETEAGIEIKELPIIQALEFGLRALVFTQTGGSVD